MSSPSQIAEPRARPLSGLPGSAAPTAREGRTYKAYGQDYQFAERLSNPPPEFVISSSGLGQAEVASPPAAANAAQTHGAADGHGDGEAGTTLTSDYKEGGAHEPISVLPHEKPWYKRTRKMWWIGGTVTVVGVISVLLAILGAMGILGGHTFVKPPRPFAPAASYH